MFKDSFKYYKSRKPPPSLEDVFDFHNGCKNQTTNKAKLIKVLKAEETLFLHDTSSWEVYELCDCPGLIYIKNPFTALGQRYWIKESLLEYTNKPNKLNIDAHNLLPQGCNIWDYACKEGHKDILKKLRWSTLGYHHNWDTKIYSDTSKDVFPENLSKLSEHFANVLGYTSFKAEAAIVNFYHLDSTLAGHTDHSEECLEAPLFSFSFGNSAIFLIGGKTLAEKPIALLLHSGDVVVMSKEARLSYHAVPKILKADQPIWNDKMHTTEFPDEYFADIDSNTSKLIQEYLEYARINLNVRQVK